MRLLDAWKIKINQRVQRFAVALEDKGLYCQIKPAEKTASIPDIRQRRRHSPPLSPTRAQIKPTFSFSYSAAVFIQVREQRVDFILELATSPRHTQSQTVNPANAGLCKLPI